MTLVAPEGIRGQMPRGRSAAGRARWRIFKRNVWMHEAKLAGFSNFDIAAALGIAESTVAGTAHKYRMVKQYNRRSLLDLGILRGKFGTMRAAMADLPDDAVTQLERQVRMENKLVAKILVEHWMKTRPKD